MGKSEISKNKSFKAALATTLAMGTLVAVIPANVEATQVQFKDVKQSHFYYESVQDLSSRGVISGYKDGTFRPTESISRGQAAKIISLALGLDTKNVKDPGFKDVPKSSPYYGYVAALVEEKIISGFEDDTFKPSDKLTRAHIAKILVKGFELEEANASNLPFKDVNKKSWSATYIQTLLKNDITKGKTATTFEPNAYVTRGEAAALIHRTEAITILKPVEIKDVTSAGITVTDGTYTLSSKLKGLFSVENLETLKGAKIRYSVKDKEIVNISYLEINANGTETKNIILDGKDTTYEGSLNILGSYVEVRNLAVKGIATVSGKTIANPVKTANVIGTPVTTTTFSNVQLDDLQVSKAGSIVELKGKTSLKSAYILADNVLLKADKDILLAGVNVQATNVSIDANVKTLNVLLKNAKITITPNSTIQNIVLPTGVNAKDVIVNYEAVKSSIENINGKVNPDAKPIATPSPGTSIPNFQLSLMHFNDTHAHVDNAAKRVTAVNEVRAAKPNALLLDAGDVFSGTLYFNEYKGLADLEFMNLMKVDAMTFGNHEFDLGSSDEGHKALADFIKAANFPFVSANVDFSKDELFTGLFNTKISETPKKANIYSGIVKEVNGQKVGIFGLTTAETKDISSPGSITFSNYIEDAKKMVTEFEKMGVNKIVALTHIGYDDNPAVDNDLELAIAVEGIDVIVGGHSHTALAEPVLINAGKTPTVIVQTGEYANDLGTLDVQFDYSGKVVGHAGKLIKIAEKAEDPEALKILKKYKDKIAEISNQETGATAVKALENPRSTDTNPYSVRSNETPLGNLVTDGMLNKAKKYNDKVVMAFQNGGGIRAGINQGPITVGEVITVLPFGNTLATMKLTGAEIKEAFEISFKSSPKENGGFLHVAGAKVKYDSSKPVGKRVVSIAYKNDEGTYTDIKDDESYTIATNAFTAKGGDGFTVFAKAYAQGRVTDLGLSDWENLREQIVSLGNVDPKVEGRIVDVAGDGGELPGGDVPAVDFSGTTDSPKVYNGDVTVSVSGASFLGNAVIKGNLVLTGIPADNLSLANIHVQGNLDLSGIEGDSFEFNVIDVDGETIL